MSNFVGARFETVCVGDNGVNFGSPPGSLLEPTLAWLERLRRVYQESNEVEKGNI